MKYALLLIALAFLVEGCSAPSRKCRIRYFKEGAYIEICEEGNTIDVNVTPSPTPSKVN